MAVIVKETSTLPRAPRNVLEIKNVGKSLGDQLVIHDLTFSVKGGETFGLLGPNGAGKTTMMRMIMNILKPDYGEILFNGQPREKLKALHFGYLPEERGLYPRAGVLEMLVYFGSLNNLDRRKAQVEAIRYLDKLGLVEYTDVRVHKLSKGIQQKVQLVAAFLHDPDVLILDEPFTGLDPINQIVLSDILKEYKQNNKILIISTHQMEMAEKLCDHIVFINGGEVILDGNLQQVKDKYREEIYIIEADNLDFLKSSDHIEILEQNNKACKIKIINVKANPAMILNQINQHTNVRRFEIAEPALHDIFIRVNQDLNKGRQR
jgi:ABC-2 type transport system ATP-binding protein